MAAEQLQDPVEQTTPILRSTDRDFSDSSNVQQTTWHDWLAPSLAKLGALQGAVLLVKSIQQQAIQSQSPWPGEQPAKAFVYDKGFQSHTGKDLC